MKNLYIRIIFVLAFLSQYSYAQTPIVRWPLVESQKRTGGQIVDYSMSNTAQLSSTPANTPVTSDPTFTAGGRDVYPADYGLNLANNQYLQMTNFFGAFGSSPFTVPDSLTITFWVWHDKSDLQRRSIFSGGDGLGIDIENNTLIIKRKESYRAAYSEFPIVESKPIFEKSGNNWYFVAITYNKYFFRLFTGLQYTPELACSYQWMGSFRQDWSSISPTTGFVLGSNKSTVKSIQRISDFNVFVPPLTMEQVNNKFVVEGYPSMNDIYVTRNNVAQPGGIINDAMVGDVVKITVKTFSSTPPTAENLPQTWIARFSGDLKYFVDESFTPGIPKPWIGFDTQVHWLNLRNYEQEPGRVAYPNWSTYSYTDPRNGLMYVHELEYVVATPMKFHDPIRGKFQWQKFSLHKENGVFDKQLVLSEDKKVWTQRANQKEGLNMQILHHWNWSGTSWINPDYTTTYSGAPYMMGFDDDEILYSHSRHHDRPNEGRHAILREPLKWQMVPVQETVSVDETVNEMVSAYYQANSNYPQGKAFQGSEIKDYYTSETNPEGNAVAPAPKGTWMHENGNIRIRMPESDAVFQIGINAESPLKKFYTIEGPNVVGREEEVDFTLASFDATVNLKAVISDYITKGTLNGPYIW